MLPLYSNHHYLTVVIVLSSIGSYSRLREQLIKRVNASQDEKIRQFMESTSIGDEKPSHFLRHLQCLGETKVPEPLKHSIWVRGL